MALTESEEKELNQLVTLIFKAVKKSEFKHSKGIEMQFEHFIFQFYLYDSNNEYRFKWSPQRDPELKWQVTYAMGTRDIRSKLRRLFVNTTEKLAHFNHQLQLLAIENM